MDSGRSFDTPSKIEPQHYSFISATTEEATTTVVVKEL